MSNRLIIKLFLVKEIDLKKKKTGKEIIWDSNNWRNNWQFYLSFWGAAVSYVSLLKSQVSPVCIPHPEKEILIKSGWLFVK